MRYTAEATCFNHDNDATISDTMLFRAVSISLANLDQEQFGLCSRIAIRRDKIQSNYNRGYQR